jgi:hypothetical protein
MGLVAAGFSLRKKIFAISSTPQVFSQDLKFSEKRELVSW